MVVLFLATKKARLKKFMFSIENFKQDPFDELNSVSQTNFVHIRIQPGQGRKKVTTVQGLPEQYDINRIVKAIKKVFTSLS